MEFSWLLSLPGNRDEGAIDYFTGELLALKRALEVYGEKEIGEEDIAEAIRSLDMVNDPEAFNKREQLKAMDIAADGTIAVMPCVMVDCNRWLRKVWVMSVPTCIEHVVVHVTYA